MRHLILCFFLLLLPCIASAMGSNNAGPVNKDYQIYFLNEANTGAIFSVNSNSSIVNPGFRSRRTYTQSQPPEELGCSLNYKNKNHRWVYARVIMHPNWPTHGKVRLRQSGNVPQGTDPVDAGLVCEVIDDETGLRIASGILKR